MNFIATQPKSYEFPPSHLPPPPPSDRTVLQLIWFVRCVYFRYGLTHNYDHFTAGPHWQAYCRPRWVVHHWYWKPHLCTDDQNLLCERMVSIYRSTSERTPCSSYWYNQTLKSRCRMSCRRSATGMNNTGSPPQRPIIHKCWHLSHMKQRPWGVHPISFWKMPFYQIGDQQILFL